MPLVPSGRMILPVIDETFQDHFDDNSWLSPQDQIDAGYPIFIQPTNPTAQFVYTHDVGTIVNTDVLLTVTCPIENVVGSVTMNGQLEISTDDVSYTPLDPGLVGFIGNFRYIRVTLDFSSVDDHYLAIAGPVRLRGTLKKKRDAGNGIASATLPVTVTFNKEFIDIQSITVTAAYNASYLKGITAVYDFVDVPYPTEFDVYLFENDTGAQVAGAFSWAAEGV